MGLTQFSFISLFEYIRVFVTRVAPFEGLRCLWASILDSVKECNASVSQETIVRKSWRVFFAHLIIYY